jgi:toxin ParE1/3/4
MPQVLRTAQAAIDLLEIWVYIAEESSMDAADRVLGTIDRKCQALAEQPGMGRRREELASGLRSLPVGSYVIFYRDQDGGIEVIRVLHGARDIEALFSPPS